MLIGFDVSQTGAKRAGCGFFAHALAEVLPGLDDSRRFAFHPDFGDFYFDPRMPLLNPYPGPRSSYGPRHLGRTQAAAFWNSPDLEDSLGRPDVLQANNFWCPIQLRSTRLVYTLYDLGFLVDPSWTTEQNRIGCFDGVFRAAVAADWIVAISEASRRHFLEVFPHFPAERTRVIHPCSRFLDVGQQGTRPQALASVAPQGFWLCVGTVEPRKNQRMLARAVAACRAAGAPALPLVFAGGDGWRMEGFPDELARLGLVAGRDVILTGYVSDDELVWLYRNCRASLYPSLFEGFGLPVLEGMQFGAPTVCSSASSLPEVAGDAALMLDPHDEAAWTATLARLAADSRERDALAARCMERAQAFSAEASARQFLALYDEAIAQPKRTVPCLAR